LYNELATLAATVAVEELAHRRHGNLNTPAVAFTGLALCWARRVRVMDSDIVCPEMGSDHTEIRLSAALAVRFIATAPVSLSRLTVGLRVSAAEWRNVVAALDGNLCHGFLQRLELPGELPVDCDDAAALLSAANGLTQVRSLRCTGGGVVTILAAVGGTLRQLELPDCSDVAALDFARVPLLRRVGPVVSLPASVTALDLSSLHHLVSVDDFGRGCAGLRDVRLPPTVTAIGDSFLRGCASLAGVLDLSHLSQLRSIGACFAECSSVADVRLPPSVAEIGYLFVSSCEALTAALDLSHLTQLHTIGGHFAAHGSAPEVRLPPSVTSIGDDFLQSCASLAGVLDLSHLSQLLRIPDNFARDSFGLCDVRLPPSVTSIGDHFLSECDSLTAVLDVSHLTRLQRVGCGFASFTSIPDVRLPPNTFDFVGNEFLDGCGNLPSSRREMLLLQNH
jgi:hypothetical protein